MPIERHANHRVWTNAPVPRGFDGITLRRTVLLRRGKDTPGMRSHELVHVDQWRRLGVVGFLTRYLWAYVRLRVAGHPHMGAYRRIPLEVEAYWLAHPGHNRSADPTEHSGNKGRNTNG